MWHEHCVSKHNYLIFFGVNVCWRHVINRTPTPLVENKTPYEMLFGKVPSYDLIRVFGCLYYAHNQRSRGDKFDSRGGNEFLSGIHLVIKGGNYLI